MARGSPRYVRWDCGFQQDPRWGSLSHYAFRLAIWLETEAINRGVTTLPKRFIDPKNIGHHFKESPELTADALRELATAYNEDGQAIIMYLRDGSVWLTEVGIEKYPRFKLPPVPSGSEILDGLPAGIQGEQQTELVDPENNGLLTKIQEWWNATAEEYGFQEIKAITGRRAEKTLACLEAGMGSELAALTRRLGNVKGVTPSFDWLVGSPGRFRDVLRGMFEGEGEE